MWSGCRSWSVLASRDMTGSAESSLTVERRRGSDDRLGEVRRRAAELERAADELAEQARRMATDVNHLTDRPTVRPRAVSVEEAARLLSLSRTSLYELLDAGCIRSLKVGSRRLIPTAALDEFLDGRRR